MPKLTALPSLAPVDEYLSELRDALQHEAKPGNPMEILHEAHTECLKAELRGRRPRRSPRR